MTLGSETSVEMHRVSVTGDHACLTRGKCHTKARYESQWMKLEEGTEFQDMAIKRGREREREGDSEIETERISKGKVPTSRVDHQY